jgi:hypothetical protein
LCVVGIQGSLASAASSLGLPAACSPTVLLSRPPKSTKPTLCYVSHCTMTSKSGRSLVNIGAATSMTDCTMKSCASTGAYFGGNGKSFFGSCEVEQDH